MQNISINSAYEKQANRVSILLFFYLLSILLLFIIENSSYRNIPYHLLSVACVITFCLAKIKRNDYKVRIVIAVFIVLCAVTGAINYLAIRNSSLLNIIECSVFNTVIACMLIEMKINTKWLKYACYAYAIVFLYRIAQMGLFVRITRFSNNQVSVALLIPAIIYYAITDINDEQISIVPSALTTLISLVSRGRTGIVASSLLFLAVFLKYYHVASLVKEKTKRKKLIRVLLGLVLLIALIIAAYTLITKYSDLIFGKFYMRGLDNKSRQIIWAEYINNALDSLLYFLLGVPKRNLMIGKLFNGNTHNSFISIHANNGIVMLAFCIGLLLKAVRYAIKNSYYIYLICIVVFCLRSFFDNMFWGTWGTTAFLVLIFIPLIKSRKHIP